MKTALLAGVFAAASALTPLTGYSQEQPNANAVSLATQGNPMVLVLDATDASRGIMRSHMVIPVTSGEYTMVYPKWIPGEHGPTGPLANISELRVSANGRPISWNRDKIDMYAFHVNVPAGIREIAVDFTVLLNAPDPMSDRNLAIVNWNRALLYQNDVNSHDYFVKPSIVLPQGWSYGTALPGPPRHGNRVDFDVVALNMLVDSPLDLGRFYKHILLWKNGSAEHWMDVFADAPQYLDFPAKEIAAYKRMSPQAFAMYGSRHWNVYHSLLTLSDTIGFEGIEHHQSSDDRASADFMISAQGQKTGGDLLTHEFSHSWNGKYRRPYDLTTLNYQIPQQTDLLWVYEGLNQYLGDVLKYRTKIGDPKDYPEYLASVYARMDSEPGRLTEPLIDTTTAAPYLYEAGGQYSSLRRTAGDFYTEGHLIWLAADVTIRRLTNGAKSLDDFLHSFTAPQVTGPITKTYTRSDVEGLLNAVAPYNWHGFFERAVYEVAPHPPYSDIEAAGWKLVYNDTPNGFVSERRGGADFWYSLGINVSADGTVSDVREGSPAWRAGLAPRMKISAVNDQEYSSDVMEYAIKTARRGPAPLSILASQNGWFKTYAVDYHGGMRYPHLVRIKGRPDMLAKIVAPH